MKTKLIIIGLMLCLSAQAQFWENNKKSFAITGVQLLSLSLEATGDALLDMGKESGNLSQMRWGHTLQAAGYGSLVLFIPMIDWEQPIVDGLKMTISWGAMRYGMFDLNYNLVRD